MTGLGRILASYSLKLAAIALLGVALFGFGLATGKDNQAGLVLRIAGILLTAFCSVAAAYIWRFANRVSLMSAEEALAFGRPLVLYLRSFADDALMSGLPSGEIPGFVSLTAEDDHLYAALSRIGPPILVENPKEAQSSQVGSPLRYPDDKWQEGVISHMRRAGLVAMRVGPTEGLRWEFEQALELLEPRKLILLLPFPKEYEAFCDKTRHLLKKPLPELTFAGKRPKASIVSMIYFKLGWEPVQVPLVIPPWRNETLMPALVHAMKPVYAQLGLQWRPAPLSLMKLMLAAYGLIFVGFFLYLIFTQ